MSLEQGVEILREEMKDRSDKDESVLRGGQAHVTEQLRLSDEIQHHRDPDVTDMVSPQPQQAVIEKEKETVTPAPCSSDDEFVSSPESRPVKPRKKRKAEASFVTRKNWMSNIVILLQEFPKLNKEYKKMDAPGKKKFASQILKVVKGYRKLGEKVRK